MSDALCIAGSLFGEWCALCVLTVNDTSDDTTVTVVIIWGSIYSLSFRICRRTARYSQPFGPVGCWNMLLFVLVLCHNPLSSLFHRLWFLLCNKHGVCNGHHCLWHYLDHLPHCFCVLLCHSPQEKEGLGLSWWWALSLTFLCIAAD